MSRATTHWKAVCIGIDNTTGREAVGRLLREIKLQIGR